MSIPEIVLAASQKNATEADFQAFVAAAKANPEEVRLVLDADQNLVAGVFWNANDLGSDLWRAVTLAMIETGSTVAINKICSTFGFWLDEHPFAEEILPAIERAGALENLRPALRNMVDSGIKSMFRELDRNPHYFFPDVEGSAKWLAEQFPPLSPALRHLVVQILDEAPSPGSDASFLAERDPGAVRNMCNLAIQQLK